MSGLCWSFLASPGRRRWLGPEKSGNLHSDCGPHGSTLDKLQRMVGWMAATTTTWHSIRSFVGGWKQDAISCFQKIDVISTKTLRGTCNLYFDHQGSPKPGWNLIWTDVHVEKQLLVYKSFRLGVTLASIWSLVHGHMLHVCPELTIPPAPHELRVETCKPLTAKWLALSAKSIARQVPDPFFPSPPKSRAIKAKLSGDYEPFFSRQVAGAPCTEPRFTEKKGSINAI